MSLDDAHDEVAMLLAQRATRPEDTAIAAAIRERLPDDELVECPVCGRTGLPERIVHHTCPDS